MAPLQPPLPPKNTKKSAYLAACPAMGLPVAVNVGSAAKAQFTPKKPLAQAQVPLLPKHDKQFVFGAFGAFVPEPPLEK